MSHYLIRQHLFTDEEVQLFSSKSDNESIFVSKPDLPPFLPGLVEYKAFVVVISAPSNYHQRFMIRQTWGQKIKAVGGHVIYFIGNLSL